MAVFLGVGFVVFLVSAFAVVPDVFVCGFASFDKDDLILAARFLCIILFLTARSTIDSAAEIDFGVFVFFASFRARSSSDLNELFRTVRTLSFLCFLIADFITGMGLF